jgi:hypothetical protein
VGRGVLPREQGPKGGAEAEHERTTAGARGGQGASERIEGESVHGEPSRPRAAVEAGGQDGAVAIVGGSAAGVQSTP